MFQKLKRKYLTRYVILTVFAFIIGLLFLAMDVESMKVLLTPKVDLYDLYADEITTPMRVEADIDVIMDYYTYTQKNGTTTEKQYFIPVGEAEYMGIALSKSYLSKADNNMQATWDYMDGDTEALEQMETIHVTGTILPLEGIERQHYKSYISDLGWTEEEEEIFLPYVLKVGYIGESSLGQFVFFMAMAAFFLIFGIIWLILGLKGNYLKNIRKYCEASGSPEMARARLEQFYATTPDVYGMRISSEYFLALQAAKVLFAESKNIIWVYQHVLRHSVNLIPVAKTYSIIFVNADGSRMEVGMKSKKKTEAAMEHIAHVLPYVFFGYDEQLQKAFKQDRQAMIQQVAERRNQIYPQQVPDSETDNTMFKE